MLGGFLVEKASENCCTSESASLVRRLLNLRAREICQVLEMRPETAIWRLWIFHSSWSCVTSDRSACSFHLSAHCSSSLNDVQVIGYPSAAAAAVAGAECLQF